MDIEHVHLLVIYDISAHGALEALFGLRDVPAPTK